MRLTNVCVKGIKNYIKLNAKNRFSNIYKLKNYKVLIF